MKSYRSSLSNRSPRAGFTLVELLIYLGITSIVVGMFTGILITVAKIQNRQTASSRSINEVGFLVNTIKRLVHESVDLAVPLPGTLNLIISTSTTPMTIKTVLFDNDNDSIVLGENGPEGPSTSTLSSNTIRIDDLVFTARTNGLSKAVDISITGTVFPDNPTQSLTKTVQSTAALYIQEQ